MDSVVLDASALIAFLSNEPGSELVERHLPGALMTTVNYSEVIARCLEKHFLIESIDSQLSRLPITVVPFDTSLARITATLKAPTRVLGLSLADRACLALALERQLPAMTSDRDWQKVSLNLTIVPFR